MAIDIRKRSRLRFARALLQDGVEFWDMIEYPEIVPQPDDTFYTVTGIDRIDLLADRFYGDPIMWWVIAVANDLELIPVDIYEGQVLRIPAPRYIQQSIFAQVLQ